MGFIDIKSLKFEYFRRDEEGNVEEIVNALQNVSLDVNPGEFIAILGRNGSGKSTLAKHMNALLVPGEGEVIVDGMDTSEEELHLSIRKTAGMVFQNPDNQIVANLVEEDVAFGPENLGVPTSDIWNRVDASLSATGMQKYRSHSPNHLSGGQKQRVAIAGVLAMEPKCIILDEATAMLDPQGREQMICIAKELQQEKGITIILITHHMEEALAADRVFVMKNGEILEQGTPEHIFQQKELLLRCGLTLPPLYQYINFLVGQKIVKREQAYSVSNVEELVGLLCSEKRNGDCGNDYFNDVTPTFMQPSGNQMSNTDMTEGILLNHVDYYYNRGFEGEHKALDCINLHIGKGEFVAVIGHTGSGKSTLMQHLNGLYLPSNGNVYFNGQDITDSDFSMKTLRQRVGLVFQYPEYQLFAETVEKDVCFGPENMNISKVEAQKRAYEAIAAVGLPDTIYDHSPLQLSGGQKRRVAIAGILAMEPEYLVLDEPTAGLDPQAAGELLKLLKRLQMEKGITVVIVSHSMEEVAEYADRLVVMDQGKICMDGPVHEVFSHVEFMKHIGLQIPVGVALLQGLADAGIKVDIGKCRKMDVCGELLKLKE